jgi:hypothetical protein
MFASSWKYQRILAILTSELKILEPKIPVMLECIANELRYLAGSD